MRQDLFDLHGEIEERHWWFVARRGIMRRLVNRVLPPSAQATVVDVGCGTGANIAALAGAYHCVGIDTSPDATRLAAQRFPSVHFVTGVAPAGLGDVARSADLFLIMDVLEHVPDDFAMLSSILAVAHPGAHVLITVPAHESLWSEHDESFGHFRRYDRERLERVWAGLPVTARLVSYYNSRLYPLVKSVRTMTRMSGRASGSGGTDFDVPPRPFNRLLTDLFEGEGARLENALDGQGAGYRTGVSLIAVLRREPGELRQRVRPADVPADLHTPTSARSAA
jgi:SAM-dependent methyltransferase